MPAKIKKMSIILIIIFTILSYGIYIPIWFLNRLDAINSLNSKVKLSKTPFIIVLVIYIFSALLIFAPLVLTDMELLISLNGVDSLISLVGMIIILIMSFTVKGILEDHYKTKLSGIATFFFWFYYLQFKINRFPDGPVQTDHAEHAPPKPPKTPNHI